MTNGEKLLGNIEAKDIDAEVQMCVVQKRFEQLKTMRKRNYPREKYGEHSAQKLDLRGVLNC